MNLTTIFTFFDGNKPCPNDIENCEALREQYLLEHSKLKEGCVECKMIALRDKYIKIILKK